MFSGKRFSAWMACAVVMSLLLPAHAVGAARVGLLTVKGAIGPASADYVVRGIAQAAEQGQQLLVLQMDTPGGLDTAMRDIIQAILASKVPVAAYVAPSGARAASAGTYILYASHVAAMAPGTNLGAATPVEIGGGADKTPSGSALTRKQVHDAAAYLRGLAQLRGRNAEWAERAVREAVSLTADEALKQNVIELVATDVPNLLAQLDGRTVIVMGQAQILATRGAPTVDFDADWRTNVLEVITNPSMALLLMTIGVYGLVFEFMSPGYVAPGVIGAICLLLGLYALQLLPVNYAGLALIGLGLVFMGLEAFLPSFGVLGLGGIFAFVVGAMMLVEPSLPGYGIPPLLIGVLAVASALLLTGTTRLALLTRRRPVVSGAAVLIGEVVKVEKVSATNACEGWVRIEGELWQAVSSQPLVPSQAVKVLARKGLTLEVVPMDKQQGA